MATTIKLEINEAAQNAPSGIRRAIEALRGARLNEQIGRAGAELFKDHFFRLNGERANKMGGKRTNFYSDAAKATSSSADDHAATITVSQQGIRQRLYGGPIKPGPGKKYLTIPARAEAYGKLAGDFHDLHFIKLKNGNAMLVAGELTSATGKFRKDGSLVERKGMEEGVVMFWLVPGVVQAADPTVIPSEEEISGVVRETVRMAFERSLGRNNDFASLRRSIFGRAPR